MAVKLISMLPNETYPVKNNVEKNIAKSNKLNIGYKKINTPEPVATAFPPLKFAKIGKTCPIIANAPNIDKKSTLPSINVGRNVAIIPLDTSHINTVTPAFFPRHLKVFVVPKFPLPSVLISVL